MSRSNKRRAARSERRANFAARAGDTASSPSKSSTTRPAPLARNLGWTARQLFANGATARPPRRKPPGRPSRRRRPRRPPNPDRRDAGACRSRRDATTHARSPSRAAEPARPSQVVAPARGPPAKARKSRRRRRGASRKQFHRRGARARGRRERMFGAGHDVPQGVGEPLEAGAVRKVEKIGGGSQGRRVEPRGARRRTGATGDECARRGWSALPTGREMFGVAQRGSVLAQPRQLSRRRSAARSARRWRSAPANGGSFAQDLVEQSEAGAGAESRVEPASAPTAGCFGGRAQDGNALFQQRVGRRGTGCRQPARPPPRQGDERRAARIGGGEFRHRRRLARIESDHGFSITQGGALSPCFGALSAALVLRKQCPIMLRLSDVIRNAPKFGKNFAFDRWTAFPGVGFFRPGLRLNDWTRSRRNPACVELWRPWSQSEAPKFGARL